jgi:hypothetical protein
MDFSVLGEFGWVLITIGVAVAVFFLVFWIARSQPRPTDVAGREKLYYEQFASPNDYSVTTLRSRIDALLRLKEELLVYTEDVGTLADDTCMSVKTVEEKYIANATATGGVDDANLPLAEQQRKIEYRTKQAKKRFLDEQAMFSVVNGRKPLLECFYADNDDVTAAEAELNAVLAEVEKVINSAEVEAAALKKEKAGMSLQFSLRYLQEAVQSLGGGKKEGFYAELSGPALIARADEIIGKAEAMKRDLASLNDLLRKEQQMIKLINQGVEKEQRGGDPRSREADMALLARQG